jgi:hypothetical protein
MVQERVVVRLVDSVPVERQLHANPVVRDIAKVAGVVVVRIAKDE